MSLGPLPSCCFAIFFIFCKILELVSFLLSSLPSIYPIQFHSFTQVFNKWLLCTVRLDTEFMISLFMAQSLDCPSTPFTISQQAFPLVISISVDGKAFRSVTQLKIQISSLMCLFPLTAPPPSNHQQIMMTAPRKTDLNPVTPCHLLIISTSPEAPVTCLDNCHFIS